MALEGIRENNDIDIILKKKIRDKHFLSSCTRISKNIELVAESWLYFNNELTDDVIIENKKHHHMFCNFKFIALELLKERKRNSLKQKDLDDIILIEKNESRN